MKTGGELHQRLIRNARRLSAPEYRAPQIFEEGRDWPGDWQGRTMLALCSLYRGLNEGDPERKAVFGQLREILEALPQHCNRDGYFGESFDGRVVNEQQVSGNSWFLRGLCEAYRLICILEETSLPRPAFDAVWEAQRAQPERYRCLVCEEDGKLLSVLNMRMEQQLHHAARIAEIMEFAVDPACRSRGIGKEMFARACADARAAGCVQIELATNQRRTGAHHFYAREGMRCSHYSFTLPLV